MTIDFPAAQAATPAERPLPDAPRLGRAKKKMKTENKETPKKLTITLTDRPPVRITEDDWPIVADAKWSDHDGKPGLEFQANRRWRAWLKVRQHADGRTIVYGCYSYTTEWQGERGADYRDGQLLTPLLGETGQGTVVKVIRAVGERLEERSGRQCWPDVIAATIADMPAEELA